MNALTKIEDLAHLPIKITYVGEVIRDNTWQADQWRVTLTSKGGPQ